MRCTVAGLLGVLFASSVGCGGNGGGQGATSTTDAGAGTDATTVDGSPFDYLSVPTSCAYQCPDHTGCSEVANGYSCPALADWSTMPHLAACGGWDGTTTPAVTTGACTASAPSGDAIAKTGVDAAAPNALVTPDGRRVRPAGKVTVFSGDAFVGGMPAAIIPLGISGKHWVATVDTGYGDHVVRVVDADQIGTAAAVLGSVSFVAPDTLNDAIAFVPPKQLWLPTSDGVVQSVLLDPVTGGLSRDDAGSIKLPGATDRNGNPIPWHLATVAVSPAGDRLIGGAVLESHLLVFDVAPSSPTYKKELGRVDLGSDETYASAFDPHDPSGRYAYVSLWGKAQVLEIDLSNPTTPKVSRTFTVDKSPQGIAFLDARWMVVSNTFGDTVSLIDRMSGAVTSVPVDAGKLHGLDPSSIFWDEPRKRLYSSLAGVNAIGAWNVDTTASPPTITPVGRMPTGWWPGGVAALDDGTLVVPNMRGGYLYADDKHFPINDGDVMGHTFGTIERIDAPADADLAAGAKLVDQYNDVASLAGNPTVSCPGGAANDFPVPPTNTGAPSSKIKHVFLIVRENKTFDGIFGDVSGVDGNPADMLAATPSEQASVWTNIRAIAASFTNADNYYTPAELSQQGHFWTVYGRSSDFNERTWAIDGYTRNIRNNPIPLGGVQDIGMPVEGSLFDWLDENKVDYDILGEAVGSPKHPPTSHAVPDSSYPGGFIQSISYPDVEKSCYVAARLRATCDMRAVTYMTLPNDHTAGVDPSSPSPTTMIAVNDEATGMFIDALTHSPIWPESLVMITEDDPAVGGDHVDIHRTPLVMVSPWVKRGYVLHTHTTVSSLHKIIANVLAIPYPNVEVEHAAIPFDAFTNTPDFSAWTKKPRTYPLECGTAAPAAEHRLSTLWKGAGIDENHELDKQVERWLKHRPLASLTPLQEAAVRAHAAAVARGEVDERDDDD